MRHAKVISVTVVAVVVLGVISVIPEAVRASTDIRGFWRIGADATGQTENFVWELPLREDTAKSVGAIGGEEGIGVAALHITVSETTPDALENIYLTTDPESAVDSTGFMWKLTGPGEYRLRLCGRKGSIRQDDLISGASSATLDDAFEYCGSTSECAKIVKSESSGDSSSPYMFMKAGATMNTTEGEAGYRVVTDRYRLTHGAAECQSSTECDCVDHFSAQTLRARAECKSGTACEYTLRATLRCLPGFYPDGIESIGKTTFSRQQCIRCPGPAHFSSTNDVKCRRCPAPLIASQDGTGCIFADGKGLSYGNRHEQVQSETYNDHVKVSLDPGMEDDTIYKIPLSENLHAIELEYTPEASRRRSVLHEDLAIAVFRSTAGLQFPRERIHLDDREKQRRPELLKRAVRYHIASRYNSYATAPQDYDVGKNLPTVASFGEMDWNTKSFSNNMAVYYDLLLNISVAGSYTFWLTVDDAGKLSIDEEEVVIISSPGSEEASVDLSLGLHKFEVRFIAKGSSNTLTVEWAGPHFGKQRMSGETFHEVDFSDSDIALGSSSPSQPIRSAQSQPSNAPRIESWNRIKSWSAEHRKDYLLPSQHFGPWTFSSSFTDVYTVKDPEVKNVSSIPFLHFTGPENLETVLQGEMETVPPKLFVMAFRQQGWSSTSGLLQLGANELVPRDTTCSNSTSNLQACNRVFDGNVNNNNHYDTFQQNQGHPFVTHSWGQRQIVQNVRLYGRYAANSYLSSFTATYGTINVTLYGSDTGNVGEWTAIHSWSFEDSYHNSEPDPQYRDEVIEDISTGYKFHKVEFNFCSMYTNADCAKGNFWIREIQFFEIAEHTILSVRQSKTVTNGLSLHEGLLESSPVVAALDTTCVIEVFIGDKSKSETSWIRLNGGAKQEIMGTLQGEVSKIRLGSIDFLHGKRIIESNSFAVAEIAVFEDALDTYDLQELYSYMHGRYGTTFASSNNVDVRVEMHHTFHRLYSEPDDAFHCRNGLNAEPVHFWKASGTSFDDELYRPWDAEKAKEYCLALQYNTGLSVAQRDLVFGIGPPPQEPLWYLTDGGTYTLYSCSSGETSSFQKDGTAIPGNCKGSSCSCFHATSGGTLSLRPFCHSGDRRCAISVKVRHISSCAAGDYLHGPSGKCTSCPAGKYSSAQAGHFCEDCQVKGCARCSSPTVCDECVSPTYTRSSDGSSCLPQNLRDVCEKYLVRKHRLSSSTDMLRSIHVGYGGDLEKILADLAKDNHDRDIGVKLCAKWYIMQLQNSASSGNLVHGECRSQEDEALGPRCVSKFSIRVAECNSACISRADCMFASTRNCNTSPHDEDNVVDALCRCELVELGGHRRPPECPSNFYPKDADAGITPNQTYTPYGGSDAYNNGYCYKKVPDSYNATEFPGAIYQ
eukprot:g516.t1